MFKIWKFKFWKCRFLCSFTIWYRIYPARSKQRFFSEFDSLGCSMLDLVLVGHAKKWHFCLNLIPADFRSLTPCFLMQSICRPCGKFVWDPFRGIGEIASKIIKKQYISQFHKSSHFAMRECWTNKRVISYNAYDIEYGRFKWQSSKLSFKVIDFCSDQKPIYDCISD